MYNCNNCGYFNLSDCARCVSCGWCISKNSAQCIPGDIRGPYFRDDCLQWKYHYRNYIFPFIYPYYHYTYPVYRRRYRWYR